MSSAENEQAFKAFVTVVVKSAIETCAQIAQLLSLKADDSCRIVVDELIESARYLVKEDEPKEQAKPKRLDA